MTLHFSTGSSSLGVVLAAASSRGVCAVFIGDDENQLVGELKSRFPKATLLPADKDSNPLLESALRAVETRGANADLPFDLRGTDFQRRVWDALREIPSGSTSTYAAIAAQIGRPRAARAVAQACGANPVAVFIPCHRVVRSDRGISGYRWGVNRKRALLQREQLVPAA